MVRRMVRVEEIIKICLIWWCVILDLRKQTPWWLFYSSCTLAMSIAVLFKVQGRFVTGLGLTFPTPDCWVSYCGLAIPNT